MTLVMLMLKRQIEVETVWARVEIDRKGLE